MRTLITSKLLIRLLDNSLPLGLRDRTTYTYILEPFLHPRGEAIRLFSERIHILMLLRDGGSLALIEVFLHLRNGYLGLSVFERASIARDLPNILNGLRG